MKENYDKTTARTPLLACVRSLFVVFLSLTRSINIVITIHGENRIIYCGDAHCNAFGVLLSWRERKKNEMREHLLFHPFGTENCVYEYDSRSIAKLNYT